MEVIIIHRESESAIYALGERMIGDGLCKVSRDSGDGRTKEVGGMG